MIERIAIILSATTILNLILITILSWLKSVKHPSCFWLGLLFFSTCMAILNTICLYIGKGSVLLNHVAMLLNLSWGAYLILFIKSIQLTKKETGNIPWKLFIPSILYILFIVYCIIHPYWAQEIMTVDEHGSTTGTVILCNLIIYSYSVASTIYLLRKEYALKISEPKIKELLWVMLALLSPALLMLLVSSRLQLITVYMPVFGQILFIYIFYRQSHTLQFIKESESSLTISYTNITKYATIKINDEKSEQICFRIQNLMETEKPYLRMEYTLPEMAKELNVLPCILSMILNSKLNSSFPDYINSLRIKTAIYILNDFHKKNLTIETVAYECGFNNRTSFYKAFKKQTGKLPSAFIPDKHEFKEVVT